MKKSEGPATGQIENTIKLVFPALKKRGQHSCAVCGLNGGMKKWRFRFLYSYSAQVCCACVEKLGGAPSVIAWLEANSIFDKRGSLIGFKREAVICR